MEDEILSHANSLPAVKDPQLSRASGGKSTTQDQQMSDLAPTPIKEVTDQESSQLNSCPTKEGYQTTTLNTGLDIKSHTKAYKKQADCEQSSRCVKSNSSSNRDKESKIPVTQPHGKQKSSGKKLNKSANPVHTGKSGVAEK